jgi:peptidyl-prolyl cis-trans isomerase D
MLAFILTDLLNSGTSIFQRDRMTIFEVNGERVTSTAFFQQVQDRIDSYILSSGDNRLEQASRSQFYELTYDEMLRDILMNGEYEELGISVTSEELWERIIRNPQIRQLPVFSDESGNFDPERIKQYLNILEEQKSQNPQVEDEWNRWVQFEEELLLGTIQQKYNNLVAAGLGSSSFDGKTSYNEKNERYNVKYIYRPYASVVDSTVEVSNKELQSFYDNNKEELYKQEEARDIEYVILDIAPSASDVTAAQEEMNEIMVGEVLYNRDSGAYDTIPGFFNTTEDSTFINANSDRSRYEGIYTKEGMLPTAFDSLMHQNEVGFVYGPYREGDYLVAAKLLGKKMIPDSVRARHILISWAGAERADPSVTRSPQEAMIFADSLFSIIENDRNTFDALARLNSDGPSKTKGGDLEWFSEGMMTFAFNNFCFQNETGKLGIVQTEFGYHIIEITDQKGANPAVKVGVLDKRIIPSEETEDMVYGQANALAAAASDPVEFRSLAAEYGLEVRPATNIGLMDQNVPGVQQSRGIVQWAFSEVTQEGMSRISELEGQVIVSVLRKIKSEGYVPFADVEQFVRQEVVREAKAEQMMEEFAAAEGTTLEDVAQSLGLSVRANNGATFANPSISGVGNEPALTGAIFGSAEGMLGGPVKGNSGVFMYVVESITAAEEGDYSNEIRTSTAQMQSRVSLEVFEAIKAEADITDNRGKFY